MRRDQQLTTSDDWDAVWAGRTLPTRIVKGRRRYVDAITDVFDEFLPGAGSALELGGAVGAYAAYLATELDYQVTVLDYSPVGARATRKNFTLLKIPGPVIEGDFFATTLPEKYDVVYSLGVAEHFSNLEIPFRAHLRFVKPGGLIMVGMPNFAGINRMIASYLTPQRLAQHNLSTMRISEWERIEGKLGLRRIVLSHVGAFEPLMHSACEGSRFDRRAVALLMKSAGAVANLRIFSGARRLNRPWFSSYLIGIYEVPARNFPSHGRN